MNISGVMGKDGQPHNNNNNNVVGIGASRKQWHLNNLGGRDNNPNAPDANEAIDDVTSDVILLECEKRLDCLVVQIEHVLCRLLSHPHLTAGRISVKNVGGGRDPDDVPLCYSSQGGNENVFFCTKLISSPRNGLRAGCF